MIYTCNIHCHTIDIEKVERMGIEDRGQWMPFSFHLSVVIACKLTSMEEDSLVYGCTTLFTENGDSYIIDTPYDKFLRVFIEYNDSSDNSNDDRHSISPILDF